MREFLRSLGSRIEKSNKSIKKDKEILHNIINDPYLKNLELNNKLKPNNNKNSNIT